MSPDRWSEICALFEAVSERPETERPSFLSEATGADTALRAEVEALLAADAAASDARASFLAAPLTPGLLALPSGDGGEDAVLGERVGAYRLVCEIGRGGMGTVYLAERADGQFEQRVAIKRVRGSHLSAERRRRFLQERALLARLSHPHIARLLDGGVTPDGQPYFVMELVEGEPITQYAERRQLGLAERLALFRDVCDAVHYAHRNLIVHRDLKPGNLFVTADGQVKLLDFGIARLLDREEADEASSGLRPFTPDYAAPEQLRGDPVTTATDVYGLGLLLFELLTGTRPFAAASRTDLRTAILQQTAPLPSTRLPPHQAARRCLTGDLDAIVTKALAKEPEQRYASAEALARDVLRHLEGKPVMARGDGVWYRACKFVRRHRAGVGAGVLMAVLIAASVISLGFQARRIAEERDKAQQTAHFLGNLFAASDPLEGGDPSLSALALLQRGARRLDTELAEAPEARAEMQLVLGRVFADLGSYAEADSLLRQALATRERLFGPDDPATAEVQVALGQLLADAGRFPEALALHRQAIRSLRRAYGDRSPFVAEAEAALGRTLSLSGAFLEAEPLLREALRHFDPQDATTASARAQTLASLGEVLHRLGRLGEAEAAYHEAADAYRALYGPASPALASVLNELGVLRKNQGDYAGAEPFYRQALDLFQRAYGPAHPRTALTFSDLGVLLKDEGLLYGDTTRFRPADALLHTADTLFRALYSTAHIHIGHNQAHLGMLALARHRPQTAEAYFRRAEAIHTAARLPPDHIAWSYTLTGLGEALLAQGRAPEAEAPLRQALAIRERATAGHWRNAETEAALGACLTALRHYDEAEPLLTDAYARLERGIGEVERLRPVVLQRLVALYRARGQDELATFYQDRLDLLR